MKIAIVGGTGAFGRALAKRLKALGIPVEVGHRAEFLGADRDPPWMKEKFRGHILHTAIFAAKEKPGQEVMAGRGGAEQMAGGEGLGTKGRDPSCRPRIMKGGVGLVAGRGSVMGSPGKLYHDMIYMFAGPRKPEPERDHLAGNARPPPSAVV